MANKKGKPRGQGPAPEDPDAPIDPADDWHISDSPVLDADYAALRARTPEDEALERELAEMVAKPGDDPYELDWPDEERDARAEARAQRAQKRDRGKAPRLVAAATIGIGTTLLFLVPIALVAGQASVLIAAATPIVVVGLLLGMPMLVLIERVTTSMPRGITGLSLMIVGGAIGFGLTYVLASMESAGGDGSETVRNIASLFMMTASATGLFVAHAFADSFRRYPLAVWGTAGVIVVLTLMGLFPLFTIPTS